MWKLSLTVVAPLIILSACYEEVVLDPGDPAEFMKQVEPPAGVFSCPDDDAFEPNDAPGMAQPAGSLVEGIRCGDNDDYFAIDVPKPDCELESILNFDASTGALQVDILDPRGAQVSTSLGSASQQVASLGQAGESGRFYARVYGPGASTSYNLAVNLNCDIETELTCPADDPSEPNDDASSAAPLTGSGHEGIICGSNEDFYSVNATAGCQLSASVFFSHELGDLDVKLLDPAGAEIASGTSSNDNETLTADVATTGAHVVRVYGYADAENGYLINVTENCTGVDPVDPENGICAAGDDTVAGTQAVPAQFDGGVREGRVCGADDYFDTYLLRNCIFKGELSFTDADGDLDITFIGPDGTIEDRSVGTTDTESILETAEADGFYASRIYSVGSAQNAYTYNAEVICRDDLNCTDDDPYESDGAPWQFEGAMDRVTGIVCGADRDKYSVRVGSGCASRIDAFFTDADGDIDIRVRDDAGQTMASGLSTTDNEQLFVGNASASTYELELNVLGGVDNDYSVRVDTRCLADLTCAEDDVYEGNNTFGQARDITGAGYAAGIACNVGGDVADWYAFRANAGCNLRVHLKNDFVTGDLDLKLFDSPASATPNKLAEQLNSQNDETINFNVTSTDTYLIKIEGFANQTNTYELEVGCQ